MGLLDDAIREHLDLKRRRGADPTEIERAERDALGPVRRGPVDPLDADPFDDRSEDLDHAHGDVYDEPDYAEPGALAFDDDLPDHHAARSGIHADPDETPELEFEPVGESPLGAEPRFEEEPLEEEPIDPPTRILSRETPAEASLVGHEDDDELEPPLAPRRTLGDETVEYDVESALEREDRLGSDEDDMLEETPDFLQDAPDHDRLWFEQRPPKDFDFDG